jgi:8-oxo-dGTP pyrophosphatase MutT (NUDIX family)
VGRVERVEDHLDRGGTLIRAAGGVLIRPGGSGVEVLVVHRPKYDDWTFPKGKADRGESDEKCALREVEEETGLRCELLHELPATHYRDAQHRLKRVRYWLMKPLAGELVFRHEVDAARWLAPEVAREVLTYPRDLTVLEGLDSGESMLPP